MKRLEKVLTNLESEEFLKEEKIEEIDTLIENLTNQELKKDHIKKELTKKTKNYLKKLENLYKNNKNDIINREIIGKSYFNTIKAIKKIDKKILKNLKFELINFSLQFYTKENFYILDEEEENDFEMMLIILEHLEKLLEEDKIDNYFFLYNYFLKINVDNDNLGDYENINEIFVQKYDGVILSLYTLIENSGNEIEKKESLKNLADIMKKMYFPVYFADFLLKKFENTENISEKILTLNCLIVLISRQSFEFEDYYKKIYVLLQNEYKNLLEKKKNYKSLFKNEYSGKFIKILEVSLKSSKLSKNVTASFIKILLKISFYLKIDNLFCIIFLIFNIAKKRKGIKELFKISRKFNIDEDQFNWKADLFNNNITQSCFWEVMILKKHYCKDIKHIFVEFEKNTINLDYIEIEAYANITTSKLLDSKLKKMKII